MGVLLLALALSACAPAAADLAANVAGNCYVALFNSTYTTNAYNYTLCFDGSGFSGNVTQSDSANNISYTLGVFANEPRVDL